MDFTTLVAGPAQAGSQSPVSKPGIGFTAGAGSAPAADAAGERRLRLAGRARARSAGRRGSLDGGATRRRTDAADEAEVPAAEGDDESPLDAPVDAATLSS